MKRRLLAGPEKVEAACSSGGRAWGKITDLSSGEQEWGLSLTFYTLMQWCNLRRGKSPQDWNRFDTSLKLLSVIKTQTTHQRFESFHCVAVATGLLPWQRYYRQLQFDRQMKSVKQQKYFINNFRERERETAARVRGAEPHLLRCVLHIQRFSVETYPCFSSPQSETVTVQFGSETRARFPAAGEKVEIRCNHSSEFCIQTDRCLSVGGQWSQEDVL